MKNKKTKVEWFYFNEAFDQVFNCPHCRKSINVALRAIGPTTTAVMALNTALKPKKKNNKGGKR